MSWLVIMSISVPVVLLFLYVIIRHAKMGKILEGMSVFFGLDLLLLFFYYLLFI